MVNWARSIGPYTVQLFERILSEKPHPEMGHRSCLGIIRLGRQYSAQRAEAAAQRALLTNACRYQSVKSILKNSLDTVPLSPIRLVLQLSFLGQLPRVAPSPIDDAPQG